MLKAKWIKGAAWTVAMAAAVLGQPRAGMAQGNGGYNTHEPPQLRGDTANTSHGWSADPIVTVGEQQGKKATDWNGKKLGYSIPGTFDGIGAFQLDDQFVRVVVNHEFGATTGAPYLGGLAGSRISYVDINRHNRKAVRGGVAIQAIYDRHGDPVAGAGQLEFGGLARFCSGTLYEAGQFGGGVGFGTRIYLCGEETSTNPGGTFWALDLDTGNLWACPDLGRGAWENATIVDTGDPEIVALFLSNDTAPRPMYLYVGLKTAGGFLEQNGLVGGQLFAWKADGHSNPADFNGTGSSTAGTWVPLANMGAGAGYVDGYATHSELNSQALALGAFQFSRPEDVATNPNNGTQVAFNSTGRSALFGGADSWGTIYQFDNALVFNGDGTLDTASSATQVTVIYDCNEASDFGIRSPDNVSWAANGLLYVQEDSAYSGFGQTSGAEASAWQLDPSTSVATRILEMDRTAVPTGQTDTEAGNIGAWESSGVLDVTNLFPTSPGETLLIFDAQSHGVVGGLIDSQNLVEGTQLLFASYSPVTAAQQALKQMAQQAVEAVWPF